MNGNQFKTSYDHRMINALINNIYIPDIPRCVVAADVKGIEAPIFSKKEKFRYTRCFSKNKATCNMLESKCFAVKFNTSRYGKFTHTIKFSKLVSINKAIKAAEEYLSQPLTYEYYEKIKDDIFFSEGWENDKDYFKCRGDCMTDTKYLEEIKFNNRTVILLCGS